MIIGLPPWWLLVTTLLSAQPENAKRLVGRIAESVHAKANDTYAALRAMPGDEVRAARAAWGKAQGAKTQEQTSQCNLLREILGNPFQPPSINPSCITPDVARLAQGIYYPGIQVAHKSVLGVNRTVNISIPATGAMKRTNGHGYFFARRSAVVR